MRRRFRSEHSGNYHGRRPGGKAVAADDGKTAAAHPLVRARKAREAEAERRKHAGLGDIEHEAERARIEARQAAATEDFAPHAGRLNDRAGRRDAVRRGFALARKRGVLPDQLAGWLEGLLREPDADFAPNDPLARAARAGKKLVARIAALSRRLKGGADADPVIAAIDDHAEATAPKGNGGNGSTDGPKPGGSDGRGSETGTVGLSESRPRQGRQPTGDGANDGGEAESREKSDLRRHLQGSGPRPAR